MQKYVHSYQYTTLFRFSSYFFRIQSSLCRLSAVCTHIYMYIYIYSCSLCIISRQMCSVCTDVMRHSLSILFCFRQLLSERWTQNTSVLIIHIFLRGKILCFLYTLSKTLTTPNIENRMNNVHIVKQFSTRMAIESFFGQPINVNIQIELIVFVWVILLCFLLVLFCLHCLHFVFFIDKRNRKTRFFCVKCTNAVCQQHSKVDYICFSCTSETEQNN